MPAAKDTWNGEEIKRRVMFACQDSINSVMADAVKYAKQNHPGWKKITGNAEASVKIGQLADHRQALGNKKITGKWGSFGVIYVLWLELKHGSFLRNAKSIYHPQLRPELARRVKSYLSGLQVRL